MYKMLAPKLVWAFLEILCEKEDSPAKTAASEPEGYQS